MSLPAASSSRTSCRARNGDLQKIHPFHPGQGEGGKVWLKALMAFSCYGVIYGANFSANLPWLSYL
jgi:hypothetical protein